MRACKEFRFENARIWSSLILPVFCSGKVDLATNYKPAVRVLLLSGKCIEESSLGLASCCRILVSASHSCLKDVWFCLSCSSCYFVLVTQKQATELEIDTESCGTAIEPLKLPSSGVTGIVRVRSVPARGSQAL